MEHPEESAEMSQSWTNVDSIDKQADNDLQKIRRRKKKQVTPLHEENSTSSINQFSIVYTIWYNFIWPFISYILSILGLTAQYAKPILAYVLVAYILIGGGMLLRNMFINNITNSFCSIPGINLLCSRSVHGVPEFDSLMTTQSTFEEILSNSIESISLPMDMKRSESSIRDLRHVVEYSNLPSRNELVLEFSNFIESARQASNDLTKYNSRIGKAVDRILSTNKWTLQVINRLNNKGLIVKLFSNDNTLYDQYIRHTVTVEDQIQLLIQDAQALLSLLQHLDDKLDLIASITARDGFNIKDDHDDLLAQLWTRLGGNKSDVKRLNQQLRILKDVTTYRKLAFTHVSMTVIKLQSISSALEDLRERVASPEVIGKKLDLERHINDIEMGVQRLESVRETGRKIEGQKMRAILDQSDQQLRIQPN